MAHWFPRLFCSQCQAAMTMMIASMKTLAISIWVSARLSYQAVSFVLTLLSVSLRIYMSISSVKERDDQAQQDQTSFRGTGDSRHFQPSIHCHVIPLFPVRGLSVPLHGVLHGRRVLSRQVSGNFFSVFCFVFFDSWILG